MILERYFSRRPCQANALTDDAKSTFYGLNRLDEKIRRHLTAATGTFIELGAYDGIQQSNTLHFENSGWRGILIEPIPEAFERCVANRPLAKVFNCACVAPDFFGSKVEMTFAGLMSVTKDAFEEAHEQEAWIERGEHKQRLTRYAVSVPARTLSSIIDETNMTRIDLLCLDVEGYELNVLKGLDLARHRPRFVVCEDGYTGDIIDFLKNANYRLAAVLDEHEHVRDLLLADTTIEVS
jgi:FkbM family methyltransferase